MDLLSLKQILASHTRKAKLTLSSSSTQIPELDARLNTAFGSAKVTFIFDQPLAVDGDRLTADGCFSDGNLASAPASVFFRIQNGNPRLLLICPIESHFFAGSEGVPPNALATLQEIVGGLLPDSPYAWLAFATHKTDFTEAKTSIPHGLNLLWREFDLQAKVWVTQVTRITVIDDQQRTTIPVLSDIPLGNAKLQSLLIGASIGQTEHGCPQPILDTVSARLKLNAVGIDLSGRFDRRRQGLGLRASFNGVDLPGLAELTPLFGAGRITAMLPDNFKQLSGIQLKRLEVEADLADRNLTKVYARIATTRSWTIAPKAVLDDIQVAAAILYPTNPNQWKLSASLDGRLTIADATLRLQMLLPTGVLRGELDRNHVLSLPKFARWAGLPDQAVPQLAFSQASASLVPQPFALKIAATTFGTWELDFLGNPVDVTDLKLQAELGSNFSARVAGRIAIGETRFSLEAALRECRFIGAVENAGELELTTLVEAIAPGFPPLPDALLRIVLEEARVEFSQHEKTFAVKARCQLELNLGRALVSVQDALFSALHSQETPGSVSKFSIQASGIVTFAGQKMETGLLCHQGGARFELHKTGGGHLRLDTVVNELAPAPVRFPEPVALCKLDTFSLSLDLIDQTLHFAATSSSMITMKGVGSIACESIEANIIAQSAGFFVSVSLSGTLSLGPLSLAGALQCEGSPNNVTISFTVASTPALTIRRLVRAFAPNLPTGAIPALGIGSLEFIAQTQNSSFSAATNLQGDWPFQIGSLTLILQPESLTFGVSRNRLAATARNKMKLAGIDGELAVALPELSATGVWNAATPVTLEDFCSDLLPGTTPVPKALRGLAFQSATIEANLSEGLLKIETSLQGAVNFDPIGSVGISHLSLTIDKPSANARKHRLTLALTGELDIQDLANINGTLEAEILSTSAKLSFVPGADAQIKIALPLLSYAGQPIEFVLLPGPLSFAADATGFTAEAKGSLELINLPTALDDLMPDLIEGSVRINHEGLGISISRILDAAEWPLPAVDVPGATRVDLGSVALDLSDIEVSIGSKIAIASNVGFGLPSRLNHAFGVDTQGNPKNKIFRVYDPGDPQNTTLHCRFSIRTDGVSLRPMDSPFEAIKVETIDGEQWIIADLGEFGAFRTMMPVLSLDTATTSLKAKGEIVFDRPLQLPLSLVKNWLRQNGMAEAADYLPNALALQTFSLLDANDQVDIQAFIRMLEGSLGNGYRMPAAIKPLLQQCAAAFNRLPDRFRQYLEISVPDRFAFDISITSDGGATIDLAVEGDPIKAIFPCGSSPQLFGFELRGFSFGELLSGSLFLVKLDFSCDSFSLPDLTSALVPPPANQYLGDSKSIVNSFGIHKLTTLIVYQTQVPIPIPLFYDKLSMNYVGVLGDEMHGEIRFPQPALNIMELAGLFGELLQFASDPDHLLDPNLSLSQSDLKFDIGSSYLRLPTAMGHRRLGKARGDVANISAYQTIAQLLNGAKTFSPQAFVESVPQDVRFGTFDQSSLGLRHQWKWALATGEEWLRRKGPARSLATSPVMKELLLENDPVASKDLSARLSGAFTAGSGLKGEGAFIVQLGEKAETAFYLSFALGNDLLAVRVMGKLASTPENGEILIGRLNAVLLTKEVMDGEVTYGQDGLSFSTSVDLLPDNPLARLEGSLNGRIGPRTSSFSGQAAFTIGNYFTLSGARLELTPSSVSVSGSYLGQTATLTMTRTSNSLAFTTGLARIGDAIFSIEKPTLKIELPQGRAPITTLSGTLKTLGITSPTVATLRANGYELKTKGKIFNAFQAELRFQNSTDIRHRSKTMVLATLGADFTNAAQSPAARQLQLVAQGIEKLVKQVEAQFAAAVEAFNDAAKALSQVQSSIRDSLKREERRLKRQKSDAQRAINSARTLINQANAKIARDTQAAKIPLDKALDKANKLKGEISTANSNINRYKRQLRNTPAHNIPRRTQLSIQIVAEQNRKTALVTTRNAATKVLNTVKAAFDLAGNAGRLALTQAEATLRAAEGSLNAANASLSQVVGQLADLANHPQLASQRRKRDEKQRQSDAKQKAAGNARRQHDAALKLNDAIKRNGLKQAVAIESASFQGKLNSISGGRVSLSIKYRILGRRSTKTTLPFNFKTPDKGLAAIATRIANSIK